MPVKQEFEKADTDHENQIFDDICDGVGAKTGRRHYVATNHSQVF